MRVLLTSMSRYPARVNGNGSSRVHDNIAKGLGELGHTVLYAIDEGVGAPLPPGVIASRRDVADADVYHFNDYPVHGAPPPRGKPWLHTYHAPYEGDFAPPLTQHFIYVSRAAAERYGSSRWVWNGIDPDEVVYSETKDDYFLFAVNDLERAEPKGLNVAVEVVQRLGARLLVAARPGDGRLPKALESPNVTFVGYVAEEQRAALFAAAKAFFFPVQIPEPFGLVVAEALMSGTPVIGSTNGSLPELVTPDVGFVCETLDEYVAAAERVDEIRPAACRERAMREFHYLTMARRYVAEYEREIAS